MGQQPDLLKSLGPDGIGYAWWRTDVGVCVGWCVRHRPDGTCRLMSDLTVNYVRSPMYELPHARRLGVEFAIHGHGPRCREPLPGNVAVLIGQRNWGNLAVGLEPPGSEPWRDWPTDCDTTRWRGETVSLPPWSVELRWPVSRATAGRLPSLCADILAHQLALWHGEGDICAVDHDWLAKFGDLIIDSETTCFFPLRVPDGP